MLSLCVRALYTCLSASNSPHTALRKRNMPEATPKAHIDQDKYKELYKQSISEPEKFWGKVRLLVTLTIALLKRGTGGQGNAHVDEAVQHRHERRLRARRHRVLPRRRAQRFVQLRRPMGLRGPGPRAFASDLSA